MRWSSGGCARSARDVAHWRTARGSRQFFGSGRGRDKSSSASLREKRARAQCGRRRACGLRTGDEADAALHETLSTAGICLAPVRLARCTCRDAKIDGWRLDESCAGTVAITLEVLYFISMSGGQGTYERA